MVFRGHIKDGRVVLDRPVELPNGTPVDVRPASSSRRKPKPERTTRRRPGRASGSTLLDQFGPIVGSLRGLPRDAARNHDHYLYGSKRR